MPSDSHEISVITYATQKVIAPLLHSQPAANYAAWVEGMEETSPGLAKFMGLGSFVTGGQVHVPDHIVMAVFVALSLVAMVTLLRRGLSVEKPGHGQQVLELIVEALRAMLDDVIGHNGRKFIAVIGTFGLFIFAGNFMGLLPGLTAPTGNLNVTLALGVFSFAYYNYLGFKDQGVKYLAHFLGPVMFLAPLMLIIEIFSHVFRPISLAIRLFGNMTGEHILGGVFLNDLMSVPLLIPVPVMALGLFVSFLQSYIFVMLSMVYIAGALAHEH